MLFTLYWLPPQATQSLCFINFRPDFSRLAISFHSHTNHPQNRCPLFLMHLAATPSTRYGNVWNKYLYKFSFYCNELYFTVLCRRLSCLDQQQLKISLDGFASFCFSLFFYFCYGTSIASKNPTQELLRHGTRVVPSPGVAASPGDEWENTRNKIRSADPKIICDEIANFECFQNHDECLQYRKKTLSILKQIVCEIANTMFTPYFFSNLPQPMRYAVRISRSRKNKQTENLRT